MIKLTAVTKPDGSSIDVKGDANGNGEELLKEAVSMVKELSDIVWKMGEDAHLDFMILLNAMFDYIFFSKIEEADKWIGSDLC